MPSPQDDDPDKSPDKSRRSRTVHRLIWTTHAVQVLQAAPCNEGVRW